MSIETIKVLVEALEYHQAQTRPIQRTEEALAAGRAAIAGAERQKPAVLPKAGTAEAEAAIRSMLRRYDYPSNSQNAGRAGWEAARKYFDRFLDAGKTMPAQEPVGEVFTMEALVPGGNVKYHALLKKPLPAGTKLYDHPQPVAQPVELTDEQWRLLGVIADKIEDGTLFNAGILSRKQLAAPLRAVLDARRTAPSEVARGIKGAA